MRDYAIHIIDTEATETETEMQTKDVVCSVDDDESGPQTDDDPQQPPRKGQCLSPDMQLTADANCTAQEPFVPKFAAQADHGEPMQSADTPEPEQEALSADANHHGMYLFLLGPST